MAQTLDELFADVDFGPFDRALEELFAAMAALSEQAGPERADRLAPIIQSKLMLGLGRLAAS